MLGFPIRTSPDQSQVSAPDAKASTVCPKKLGHKDARVHYANLKQQTATKPHPPPDTRDNTQADVTDGRSRTRSNRRRARLSGPARSVSSGPNSVFDRSEPPRPAFPLPPLPSSQCSTNERAERETFAHGHGMDRGPPGGPQSVLLRKEVIQPHLPVRLPCYDFVPIASPTFDRSPQTRLVGPRASGVADFRDVTGGVYKARERIHRSVADLRLLATPTSWGRVADPNPN